MYYLREFFYKYSTGTYTVRIIIREIVGSYSIIYLIIICLIDCGMNRD